jgi:hypothetical protein
VKTEKLIDMLSTNLEAVDHRQLGRRLKAVVALGSVIALGAMAVALGVRPDLASTNTLPALGLKLGFAAAVIALSALALNAVMRPGGERKMMLRRLLLPFIAITLLAIISLAWSPRSHWQAMVFGAQWVECLVSIPLIAIAPFALITWAVRQAAPTDLARAGALVGLTAGSISAMGYALHCTDDRVPFVALWYSATIAICTIAGFKLGPGLLRW